MLFGAAIGAALYSVSDDILGSLEDRLRPVTTGRIVDVHRDGDEIHFRLLVTRLRPECVLLGAYAYGVTQERVALRLEVDRIDATKPRDAPPGVEVDVGEWRIYPIDGVKTAVMHSHHSCDGRLVSTKLVEVPV